MSQMDFAGELKTAAPTMKNFKEYTGSSSSVQNLTDFITTPLN